MARKKTDFELNFLKNIQSAVKKTAFNGLPDAIRRSIEKGVSPVQGGGRFKRYSDSYRKAIKNDYESVKEKHGKQSPVDMTLTGDMLKSLDIVDSKPGTVRLEFDDPKAYYHNNSGAGKSRVIRRLLPDREGEKFSRSVQLTVLGIFQGIISKVTKK